MNNLCIGNKYRNPFTDIVFHFLKHCVSLQSEPVFLLKTLTIAKIIYRNLQHTDFALRKCIGIRGSIKNAL